MKQKIIIAVIFLLTVFLFIQRVSAQWYLDSATPEEAAARVKPYRYLQNQIQENLCSSDWGINKSSFSYLCGFSIHSQTAISIYRKFCSKN